jgi:hypothetical protein
MVRRLARGTLWGGKACLTPWLLVAELTDCSVCSVQALPARQPMMKVLSLRLLAVSLSLASCSGANLRGPDEVRLLGLHRRRMIVMMMMMTMMVVMVVGMSMRGGGGCQG